MASQGRSHLPQQQVQFCQAPDGVRIAYAVHGQGPPLLISTCWLSHLQFDWESPVWRHFLRDLGQFATVIRFDERGHGLSDWDVTDHSLQARIGDLEAVADAAGFPTFALMAMAQGGPVAISYTARHPERVSRLIFYGSYSSASQGLSAEDFALEDTFGQLIKVGWARPDSTFRRVFTSLMIPGATEEQMCWLDDLQRVAVSAGTAYTARQQRFAADADALLPQLSLPTLILHSVGDRMNSFEYGRHLAASIAGARLVALEGENHIVLEEDAAWPVFVAEVRQFLAADGVVDRVDGGMGSRAGDSGRERRPPLNGSVDSLLSPRELDVLRLVADGRENEEIAVALQLSRRTVERHLQNIYGKLGLQGRSARIAAARLLTPV
ncbi:pimeloyl-ACP methyl ester carboxylesterase [Jatrophihabitans sp. GAS493]|uniref:alpha/beta fold hydrolase n=1 Tax=Jatrophihabitans sp. GAS493 TaxID=1907575 RepID=UPI000BB8E2E0|nr:alpha/beta fold hydrolase [Jatrophihabitans sp. GAS493]SOD74842.1 pimeloyl-ACP methyl ester carboxylesterase [Jatrophihabitans sp. GAS493]